MKKKRAIAAAAGLIALVFLWPLQAQVRHGCTFLWLSDLHFDPTANPKLVDDLAQANVNQWPRILASSPASFSEFGQDTSWPLLSSTFAAITKVAPDAQFAVITGDALVHHFRQKFESTAQNHDEEAFRQFAAKTMQFIAAQLTAVIPGKPILFALGNNDSDCGNYELEPDGPFLRDGVPWIAGFLGPLADETVRRDWTALGSYTVPHPSLKHVRVIAVNSVYFSPRYHNACSTGGADAGDDEMHWLESKLADAQSRKEQVWLIFHIPPGIDGYASSHPTGEETSRNTVPMWKPIYTEQFQKLLTRYHKTIIVSLAGHEHTDDFRLIAHSLVLLTPAVSPLIGQNPAFRTVAFQPNGAISDDTTYYLSNLDTVHSGASPQWKREYDFAEAWGVHHLNFGTVSKIYHQIENTINARDRWATFYSVSCPAGKAITPKTFPWVFCASGNVSVANYDRCVVRIQNTKPQ